MKTISSELRRAVPVRNRETEATGNGERGTRLFVLLARGLGAESITTFVSQLFEDFFSSALKYLVLPDFHNNHNHTLPSENPPRQQMCVLKGNGDADIIRH